MNNIHLRLISIFLLVYGLAVSPAALAQDMVIEAASPEWGEQGDSLPVTITGRGFDDTVDDVKFILHCGKKNCPDTGDIIVDDFVVNAGEGTITTEINILDTAQVASFDIVLRSTRGRGGKGTTFKGENKFSVKIKPNETMVNCDIFAPKGSCTCMFSHGSEDNIYGMLGDCVTSETLYLTHMIRTAGTVQTTDPDGPVNLTLTAVNCGEEAEHPQNCEGVLPGTFDGSSVIANVYHRARIRYIDIIIGEDVEAGCSGGLASAISFVLHEDLDDPAIPDPLSRNSVFLVWNVGIYSKGDPLCNGIEIIRTKGYTDKYSDPDPIVEEFPAKDWKVSVAVNKISAGSYVEAGIVYLGMMPSETINPPAVVDNIVGGAACVDPSDPPDPIGILFGNLLALDAEELVEGVVEGNAIDMTGGCPGSKPIGVQVVGDDAGIQTTAKVSKNEISGAFVGVEVDCNVVDVNISGNTLTGDSVSGDGDTGVDSYAQSTREKGKPNKIAGFDFNIIKDHDRCPQTL